MILPGILGILVGDGLGFDYFKGIEPSGQRSFAKMSFSSKRLSSVASDVILHPISRDSDAMTSLESKTNGALYLKAFGDFFH